MGKNQTYKAMQRSRVGTSSADPAEIEDGMMDGSFHSPEWHAARLASLKTSHTVTWEEFKKKQKEDELKIGEVEADKDRMMREYRAQLDAERAMKLSHGRNHSSIKSHKKKERKDKDVKRKSSKKRKADTESNMGETDESKETDSEPTGDSTHNDPEPNVDTPHSKPKDIISHSQGPPAEQIDAPKAPSSLNRRDGDRVVQDANASTGDGSEKSCQIEFGSYCHWSIEHKEVLKDSMVKQLKDQLFVARAYYPSIAKLQGQDNITRELKQHIQEHEHMLSEAISDVGLPPLHFCKRILGNCIFNSSYAHNLSLTPAPSTPSPRLQQQAAKSSSSSSPLPLS